VGGVNAIFQGKTVILSGATRGIGRAIALEFAGEGAKISFNFIKSSGKAESLVRQIENMGTEAKSFQVDMTDYKGVKRWVEETRDSFGDIDIVVNNAGIIKDRALALMEESDWHDVIATNLDGTFNLTRAAIVPFMKQKKGVVINISSISGIIGMSRQVNYSASKAGIIGFTKALAREVAPYNVRVNAVAPGFIETEMLGDLKEDFRKQMMKQIPLSRFGKCEDIAKAVKFLASDHAGYITGHTLVIDGGMS
jgi:3-oxoacyl-[acyl-carrier protein] reductase